MPSDSLHYIASRTSVQTTVGLQAILHLPHYSALKSSFYDNTFGLIGLFACNYWEHTGMGNSKQSATLTYLS